MRSCSVFSPKALCRLLQNLNKNSDILTCKNLHNYILEHGFISDSHVPNYLIRAYTLCGCLPDAQRVFDQLVCPTAFTWSAIISAYAEHQFHEHAFSLYTEMYKSKIQPDGHIYVAVLTACVGEAHLARGKMVHTHILGSSYKQDLHVNTALIEMYAKCGSLIDAQRVFDSMPSHNTISWNVLIAAYMKYKNWQHVLMLFVEMGRTDNVLSPVTMVCVLKACANLSAVIFGMLCHSLAMEHGFELVVHVINVLIDVYVKCGSFLEAEALFAKSSKQDVVTWTSMIGGYASYGLEEKSIQVYEAMQKHGVEANGTTFASVLKACSSLASFDTGRLIHASMIERGSVVSIVSNNALIGMYSRCGSFCDAMSVFVQSSKRDVVTWNTVIAGCAEEHGQADMAVQLFKQLQQEGMQADSITLASMARACSHLRAFHEGKVSHVQAIETGCDQESHVCHNLMHMYVESLCLEEARRLFDSMLKHDTVSWNVIIGGYANSGQVGEAFRMFHQMLCLQVQPSPVTLVYIFKACSLGAALNSGQLLHAYLLYNSFNLDAHVGSALVHFYAQCGSLNDARKVFIGLQNKSLVSWSALIAGFALQKDSVEALDSFKDMHQHGIELDDVVYVSLLSACSHGELEFQRMVADYGFTPSLKHYNCLVDHLGRVGHLNEALSILQGMPFQPNTLSHTSMLSHCRTHCHRGLLLCTY